MKLKPVVLMVSMLGLGLSAGAGYWLGHQQHTSEPMATSTASVATPTEKKALYWYDPMKPDQHFDKPGKSPFMDMDLVPKYADDTSNTQQTDNRVQEAMGVRIDPSQTQSLGVRIVNVEQGELASSLSVTGVVQFNDRQVAVVQTRSAGFVQQTYGRAMGDVIAKGAPLADLLIPDWSAAQLEYLATVKTGDAKLVQAAKQRMLLIGMPEDVINQVARTGRVQPTVTIRSPMSGVISTLDVRQGMSLSMGQSLAKINGLYTVWVEAAVPEASSGDIHVGAPVNLLFTAYAGQQFKGTITAILPDINAESHTVRVRVELSNPHGKLRPGMYAQVSLNRASQGQQLLIPEEAVFRTGKRNVVIIAIDQSHFQPVEVQLGQAAGGKIAVLSGLKPEDRVVASGQFLIDSEASLQGVMARMNSEQSSAIPIEQQQGATP